MRDGLNASFHRWLSSRREFGATTREIAATTGISESYVRRLLDGASPTLKCLDRVVVYSGEDPRVLLGVRNDRRGDEEPTVRHPRMPRKRP